MVENTIPKVKEITLRFNLSIYPWSQGYTCTTKSFTGSDFSHVAVEVNDCVYSVQRKFRSGWFMKSTFPPANLILRVPCKPFPVSELESLPVGEKYPLWRTVFWWVLMTIPPSPFTCVQAAVAVLRMGGFNINAKTVEELYHKARKLPQACEVLCGPEACGQGY